MTDVEQFGRYRLEELIGRGGMGEVFRAFDTVRGRMVALKRLPSHLADDGEFQARFRKEAALAARLSEPHIVPIHDFGEIDGLLFIDMRLVDGRDLGTVLAEDGPLDPSRAVSVLAQVAGALDAAHADGLVHRDVKPSNVLLTGSPGREFCYLVDFGIARTVGTDGRTSLTVTGATVGTLAYMAPERFLESDSDHRADVYSLACMLFESLTGHKPFPHEGLPAMIHAHLNVEPPSPSRERPAVPFALDAVVAKGMAKNAEDRFQTAGAMADAALAAVGGRAATGAPEPTDVRLPPTPQPGHHAGIRQYAHQFAGPPVPTLVGPPPPWAGPPAVAPARPAPPPAPARTGSRWPLVVAGVVVTVVAVVALVLVVIGSGRAPAPVPATTATPPTSTSAPSPGEPAGARTDIPQPPSSPGGDRAADTQLWDTLKGGGVRWSTGCSFSDPAGTGVRSDLTCSLNGTPTDGQLGFELYRSGDVARDELDGYTALLTGAPGSCESGGKFSGELLGRYATCGVYRADDGTSSHFLMWTKPGVPVLATLLADDPAQSWAWFVAHDPF
jgi:Protein kinase domain